jgi:hypothetical protein
MLGWFAFRERDLSRIPVESLDALEQELESLRVAASRPRDVRGDR